MKKDILKSLLIIISAIFLLNGCSDDDNSVNKPTINIAEDNKKIEGANEGDIISIPFSASSEDGIRQIAYYFIVNTANGTKNETPVILEQFKENFPSTYDGAIEFPVRTEMNTLILVVFNKENNASEIHIPLSGLKELPVFTFDKNIDVKRKAFLEKNLKIKGNINSEYDIKTITYRIVNNGVAGSPINIPVTNKNNMDFNISFIVEAGLENVLFDVVNIHDGKVSKTFTILEVATDDDISIEMTGEATEISDYMEGEENIITGVIESGSDIIKVTYSIKKNGVFGTPVDVEIPSNVADVFEFSIGIPGEMDTEAIKLEVTNESELVENIILNVPYVDSYIVHKKDVVLTTEIGPGKNNWFSCYLEPHLFDQETAAKHSEMMDFVAAKHSNNVSIFSSMVYTAGGAYATSVTPYLTGFKYMSYLLMTAHRAHVQNNFHTIEKTSDMEAAFKSDAYYATAGRYISGNLAANRYHAIAWGEGSTKNKALGMVYIKEVTPDGENFTIKFDIKYGKPDSRSKYNPMSLQPYNPAP